MKRFTLQQSITNKKDSISLQLYLHEISKYRRITIDEEVELAQRIKKGDKDAIEKLTKSHLRFVVSVAKQFQHNGLDIIDLVNEGNIGLIKAAEKFDETRGFKFISYAVWWIRQSIIKAIENHSTMIKIPCHKRYTALHCEQTIYSFEQKNERKPSIEEISELTKIWKTNVHDALTLTGKHISFNEPVQKNETESTSMIDFIEDSECIINQRIKNESLQFEIEKAIKLLPQREQDIIRCSFGIGVQEESLDSIGEKLQLSNERVRQLRLKAIDSLRNGKKQYELKSFLG